MKRLILMTQLLMSMLMAVGQTMPEANMEIYLWPEGVPSDNGLRGEETDYGDHCTNVTDPLLWVYLPEHPNGLAVLACPGGGYVDVWYRHEGKLLADWYNQQGIVYAVLKYRLPNGHHEVPLQDVHQAMHIVRSHADDWNIKKLGIQGCSAGGHLAATAATHYTADENRPDFQILFYPVITMDTTYTHMGSHEHLLGTGAEQSLIDRYCNEKMVTPDTPPAFIMASSDDGLVPVRNSVEYYTALVNNHVQATMHLYPEGGHGWCWKDDFAYKPQYCEALKQWLKAMCE